MTEKVRLVIWDLDETFWHGTLTEGGMRIRPETCALVKNLAQQGIMSSICSKNDFDDVKPILEREGVWDYFVFPSINWEPKGPRIAAMVEQFQLRAPTVMFIDDNPLNLQEVLHFVPEIQVQSHEFIPQIAESPLFQGRNDHDLSRLNQYKLLETRHVAQKASGDNVEFLRKSNIRVYIERDIVGNIDRAIELINRTNQLNYTKLRLPEDPEEARQALRKRLEGFESHAGLVQVIDDYGDYGFVGFYLAAAGRTEVVEGAAWSRLVYYCFSCRTLGMYVEQWLYQYLRSPELNVVGEVLTDLSEPRTIDWVRLVSSPKEGAAAVEPVAPEIRIHGGCESHALSHYLSAYAKATQVSGNFASGGLFVRLNAASLLLSACDRRSVEFEEEALRLGVPYNAMAFDYFNGAPNGAAFVFGGGLDDSNNVRFRHKQTGWEIKIEANGIASWDFLRADEAELSRTVEQRPYNNATKRQVFAALSHVRQVYEPVSRGEQPQFAGVLREMFGRIPVGSNLILVLQAERGRFEDGNVRDVPWIKAHNNFMRAFIRDYPFVGDVCFDDVIEDDAENLGHNHYSRMVYFRLANAIVSAVAQVPKKAAVSDAVTVSPELKLEPAIA